jgi:hypothetical protein
MNAHLRYLRYVLRHKWFVLVAGLRTGAPLWRLLIHDWSKFLPSEWFAYVRMFYGPKVAGDPRGASASYNPGANAPFDRAWLHHVHLNPHHWQHWLLKRDSGDLVALEMPENFVREMVADWMGAGRAQKGVWEVADWYAMNRDKMLLHDATRLLVESLVPRWRNFAVMQAPA